MIPIALKSRPPVATLHLKIDGLLLHQLISQGAMLILKDTHQSHEIPPFGLGEFEGPGLPSDQAFITNSARVPGEAPSRTLLLNHPGSRSG